MIAPTALRKRSVVVDGHSTSVTLEHAFWQALRALAAARRCSVASLIADIDRARGEDSELPNLSSAIRVHILRETLSRIP